MVAAGRAHPCPSPPAACPCGTLSFLSAGTGQPGSMEGGCPVATREEAATSGPCAPRRAAHHPCGGHCLPSPSSALHTAASSASSVAENELGRRQPVSEISREMAPVGALELCVSGPVSPQRPTGPWGVWQAPCPLTTGRISESLKY